MHLNIFLYKQKAVFVLFSAQKLQFFEQFRDTCKAAQPQAKSYFRDSRYLYSIYLLYAFQAVYFK